MIQLPLPSPDLTELMPPDEVVFVKEVLPPTPLKQKAAQYQLPPSFYNKRNESCKGCIGCLTDEDYHDVSTTRFIELVYLSDLYYQVPIYRAGLLI